MNPREVAGVRLDKWLWAARFYKTRSLAKQAIDGGHVRVGGERAKVARELAVGLMLNLRRGTEEFELQVLALSDQRGGAPEAQRLYAETEASRARRERAALERRANALAHPDQRPDKQQRRRIVRFKRAVSGEPG
ncbi:MAG: S4 domain-containing protein [Stagnimonas sp.]|nr:S4 domain-containing protein [Stagnimonas sp.]